MGLGICRPVKIYPKSRIIGKRVDNYGQNEDCNDSKAELHRKGKNQEWTNKQFCGFFISYSWKLVTIVDSCSPLDLIK